MAERHWIGNGGKWTVLAHWAEGILPTENDKVIFDSSSFTLDDHLVDFWDAFNTPNYLTCKEITFDGVTHTPSFIGNAHVTGGGNIISNSVFSGLPPNIYIDAGTYQLIISGTGINNLWIAAGATAELTGDLNCEGIIDVALGATLNDSGGYDINATSFICRGTFTFTGSAVMTLIGITGYTSIFEATATATMTIGANTTIQTNNFYGGGFSYGNVIVHDYTDFMGGYYQANINGSNTFTSLKIEVDYNHDYYVYFEDGSTQTITSAGGFTLENSGGSHITFAALIDGWQPGGTWYIVCGSGIININALSSDNLGTLSNSHASGGATFKVYAEDGGGNTGWDFMQQTPRFRLEVAANFESNLDEAAEHLNVAANFDTGMEEQQTEINVSAIFDEISQNDIYLSEINVTAELTATVNTYEESVSDEINLVDTPSLGEEDPLAVTVDESIDLADAPFNELPMSPLVIDELGLADDPTYSLEMAQSIIDEFLLLMDSQELVWTFSDHSAFEDEVVESLVVVGNQTYGFAMAPAVNESLDLVDSHDLAWLDSILETFDLSDEMGVKWLKELIETIFIYDEVKHGWRVTTGSSLILTDTIQTLLGIIVDEWINFIDIQSNNWNGREIISEGVTLYDIAGFAKIYADSLSDEINIADVSTYQLTITVLEYLGFTELANAMRTSAAAINDSLDIADNPALAFPQSVKSILNVVDLSTVAVRFLQTAQSDLGLADVSSLIKRISDTLTDPIIFVDTITSHAHLYSLIYDTLHLDVLVDLEGEFYECYVLNTPKFMPSIYSGFNFNSYCVYENRAFAANDTGIYELTGNTDDGDTIHTGTILSATDFGSPNQKRFRRGYLGISGDSPIMIFETEDGTRQAFNIDTQGKTVISSALKSKKWKLSLADFNTVDHIKLIPVILTK